MIKDYYSLTKPGIIYGNAITVVAGFILASHGDIDWWLLLATLVGLSLVVASGCVFNNYIDRDIDAQMERTKGRALVRGVILPVHAIAYAITLGVLGTLLLFFYTNLLTVVVALVGLFVYVVVYSLWFKRHSVQGTLIGSISGAIPPVVGYLAVSNSFDAGAIILFLIVALWQMPHSFAIAIYRLQDYLAASVPVLPVKKGVYTTKIHMLAYILLFTLSSLMPTVFGYKGWVYFAVMTLLGLTWLGLSVKGFWVTDDRRWARNMFIFSIVVIAVFAAAVSVDGIF